MRTSEQAPWAPYLIINEETGERTMSEDAPEEIRTKYNEYLSGIARKKQNGEPFAK